MGKVILFTLIIVLISVLLLGIKVFFVRGGRFPDTHIGDNAPLKKRGISCAVSTDRADRSRQGLYIETDKNYEHIKHKT